MKYIIFAIFLLCILLPWTSSRRIFFRTDYTYFENFDAFYKVHREYSDPMFPSWNIAFKACADEGATLFYPNAEREWTLVKNLTDSVTDLSNVTDIFVGIRDEFKLGEFLTVDGRSWPAPLTLDTSLRPDSEHTSNNCIAMNTESGLFKVVNCFRLPDTALPFVCKKVEEKTCPTIDRGYKYMNASRKCYKVNEKLKQWQEAMKTCFIEGGTLAVLENKAQANEVLDMIKPEKKYFVGVRKISKYPISIYYTVKGKKFSQMYQNPGGSSREGDYGTVRKQDQDRKQDLYTDTEDALERLPFICEMEVAA